MTQSGPPPEAIAHIPILRAFRLTHGIVFGNLGALLRAAAFPFLLSWVIFYSIVMPATTHPLLSILATLIALVPYALFAVAWHRFTLLGRKQALPALFPIWKRRHWRFYGYLLAMLALLLVAALPIGLLFALLASAQPMAMGKEQIPFAISIIVFGGVVFLYLSLRWSFVFPAVSVDEAYGLGDAWRHSRGQGLRLVFAVLLCLLPIGLLSGAITLTVSLVYFGDMRLVTGESLVDNTGALVEGAEAALFADSLITQPLGYMMTALFVTLLSFAFRISTGWVPDESAGGTLPASPRNNI